MKSFFTDRRWPAGVTRRLHVYALPDYSRDLDLLSLLNKAREVLDHVDCVKPVDVTWQHLTLQMIDTPTKETTVDQRDDLINALHWFLSDVPTIQLPVGGIMATRSAVIANVGGDEIGGPWHALRERVRKAIDTALGPDVMTYDSSTPHSSVAYGIADGDSGAISSSLLYACRPPFATWTIDRLHLVDVTQDADNGTYTWEPVSDIPFGDRQNRPV